MVQFFSFLSSFSFRVLLKGSKKEKNTLKKSISGINTELVQFRKYIIYFCVDAAVAVECLLGATAAPAHQMTAVSVAVAGVAARSESLRHRAALRSGIEAATAASTAAVTCTHRPASKP